MLVPGPAISGGAVTVAAATHTEVGAAAIAAGAAVAAVAEEEAAMVAGAEGATVGVAEAVVTVAVGGNLKTSALRKIKSVE